MSPRPKPLAPWEVSTKTKRDALLARIPAHWRLSERELRRAKTQSDVRTVLLTFLSPVEQAITALSVSELLLALRQGDYTACEVVAAFGHRAVVAHQLSNCLSELDLEAATARAQQLDAHFREHRSPMGPLHGLPVSLMDRFHIAGLDSTCGFASWIDKTKTADDEGTLLRALRRAGALIYCKTNVPMGALMGETINNITGFTVNPCNTALSAGGAAGGEGALLALGGSAVGIATDLVGSSRIPAAFSGISALKTSEARLSTTGIGTILKGLPVASGTIGIMAKDISCIEVVFKALLGSDPWRADPTVIEMPWRSQKHDEITRRAGVPGQSSGRLVFGLMSCDKNVRPHPNIAQGLEHVKQTLEKEGHKVVDWNPPSQAEAVENLLKIFGSASGPAIIEAVKASGEPPVAPMRSLYDQQNVTSNSSAEFWDLCQWREDYRQAYAKYWTSVDSKSTSGRSVDGIILPVAPMAAVLAGEFHYFAYSAIANVLDFPAAVFPVTRGDNGMLGSDFELTEPSTPPTISAVPVCLQVMCPRLQEERVLALASVIVKALDSKVRRV